MSIEQTLEERGSRYGRFSDHSTITQNLKRTMMITPKWTSIRDYQREALEMIQHKIGRILNGDADYIDSWHDISGYAQLVEKELLAMKE